MKCLVVAVRINHPHDVGAVDGNGILVAGAYLRGADIVHVVYFQRERRLTRGVAGEIRGSAGRHVVDIDRIAPGGFDLHTGRLRAIVGDSGPGIFIFTLVAATGYQADKARQEEGKKRVSSFHERG